MLKKILFTIFFIFVMIAPISANFPSSAYVLPWNNTWNYVIFSRGTETHAMVTKSTIFFVNGAFFGYHPLVHSGNDVQLYILNNGVWQTFTSSSQQTGVQWTRGLNTDFYGVTIQSVIASNTNIRDQSYNILFQQAPFLMPAPAPEPAPEPEPTPEQAREGATLEALNQLIHRIFSDLLTVLPAGLLVLSLILAIPLLKRWRGFLRL